MSWGVYVLGGKCPGGIILQRDSYTCTELSYLQHFLARSGKFSYVLLTSPLIGQLCSAAGNRFTACLGAMTVATGNNRQDHNMYKAEMVLGQRESTCR